MQGETIKKIPTKNSLLFSTNYFANKHCFLKNLIPVNPPVVLKQLTESCKYFILRFFTRSPVFHAEIFCIGFFVRSSMQLGFPWLALNISRDDASGKCQLIEQWREIIFCKSICKTFSIAFNRLGFSIPLWFRELQDWEFPRITVCAEFVILPTQ